MNTYYQKLTTTTTTFKVFDDFISDYLNDKVLTVGYTSPKNPVSIMFYYPKCEKNTNSGFRFTIKAKNP